MIYYLIVFTLLVTLDYQQKSENRYFKSFCILYIMIFMCGGFMCGSDWRSYELDYSYVSSLTDTIDEPGYYVLSIIAKKAGLNFWFFNIFLKMACFVVFWKFISKFSENNKYLSFLFFFSFYGIYLLIDAPLRNTCAISLFLIAILCENKSRYLPWIFSICSIFFHSTGVISILYLLLKKYHIPTYIYVIIYIISIYISFNSDLINSMVGNTLIGQLLFAEKISRYLDNGFAEKSLVQTAASLGEMLKIGLFLFVVINRNRIEIQKNGRYIFSGIMLFFIFSKIGASMDVLMRFGCYFSFFYAIGLVAILNKISIKSFKLYKCFLISLALYQTCATITTDYRFVPYTNYFIYGLFNDIPSYSERSQYNYKNSPFK